MAHTHTHNQPCKALTSSVEVSESPWQLYNGAGLIQSQGRMVGLLVTQRENWSGSGTYSGRSWCVSLAACSVTEEKHSVSTPSKLLHPHLIFSFFFLAQIPCGPPLPFSLILTFSLFIHLLFSNYPGSLWLHFLDFLHPSLPLPLSLPHFRLRSINISYTPSLLSPSLPLTFRHRQPDRISLVPLDLVVLLLSLPEEDGD